MLSIGCTPVVLQRAPRKNTLQDTCTPYPAQYPPEFQLVNATGVLLFRTRHVSGPRRSGPPECVPLSCGSGPRYSFTRRHHALRHGDVGFPHRPVYFARPRRCLEPVGEQVTLKGQPASPNAFEG